MVSSSDSVLRSGVGEPFLDQPTRYHCPIFCCLLFNKNTQSCFKRKIWKYFSGDFSKLRNSVTSFDGSSCFDTDISKYAENFTNQLLSFYDETIPSKIVIEYADVVFDNTTTSDIDDLEFIQAEGARIITGATRLVSLQKLVQRIRA